MLCLSLLVCGDTYCFVVSRGHAQLNSAGSPPQHPLLSLLLLPLLLFACSAISCWFDPVGAAFATIRHHPMAMSVLCLPVVVPPALCHFLATSQQKKLGSCISLQHTSKSRVYLLAPLRQSRAYLLPARRLLDEYAALGLTCSPAA